MNEFYCVYIDSIHQRRSTMNYQQGWQDTLYNGLVPVHGKPTPVSTGSITKPNRDKQVAEHMIPSLEVYNDNSRMRGLTNKSKQRSMAFLPQE